MSLLHIVRHRWLSRHNNFEIWLPSNREIYWAQLDKIPHREVEEIAKEYIEMGFSIFERYQ